MNEMTIKSRLAEALQEPSPPADLIDRTVVRVRALVDGRNAEQRLDSEAVSPEERLELAAQSTVGRLMARSAPPNGVTAEAMAGQLLADAEFRTLADRPQKELASMVKSGRMVSELAHRHTASHKAASAAAAPVKQQKAPKKGPQNPAL